MNLPTRDQLKQLDETAEMLHNVFRKARDGYEAIPQYRNLPPEQRIAWIGVAKAVELLAVETGKQAVSQFANANKVGPACAYCGEWHHGEKRHE